MKTIAYLSHDEVNAHTAGRFAAKYDSTRILLNGEFDAVIYDLEFIPPPRGQEILDKLLADPVRGKSANILEQFLGRCTDLTGELLARLCWPVFVA